MNLGFVCGVSRVTHITSETEPYWDIKNPSPNLSRQSHATCYNGGNPRNAVAPQVGKPAHGAGSPTVGETEKAYYFVLIFRFSAPSLLYGVHTSRKNPIYKRLEFGRVRYGRQS